MSEIMVMRPVWVECGCFMQITFRNLSVPFDEDIKAHVEKQVASMTMQIPKGGICQECARNERLAELNARSEAEADPGSPTGQCEGGDMASSCDGGDSGEVQNVVRLHFGTPE